MKVSIKTTYLNWTSVLNSIPWKEKVNKGEKRTQLNSRTTKVQWFYRAHSGLFQRCIKLVNHLNLWVKLLFHLPEKYLCSKSSDRGMRSSVPKASKKPQWNFNHRLSYISTHSRFWCVNLSVKQFDAIEDMFTKPWEDFRLFHNWRPGLTVWYTHMVWCKKIISQALTSGTLN